VTVTLGGMAPVDLQRYVEQRLGQDGPEGVVLGPGALARITRYTGGLPGLVNRLCDRVRQTPSARITDRISADAVDEAAESLGLARPEPDVRPSLAARLGTPGNGHDEETPGERRRPSRWRRIAALAVIAAVVTALVVRVGPEAAGRGPAVMEASRAWLDQRGWLAVFTKGSEPEAKAPSRDERPSGRPAKSAPTPARTRPPAPATSAAKAEGPERQRQVAATPPARRPARPSPRQIGALFGAAREGQMAGVTEALEVGVPVDARDPQGNTPLMHAVAHGREAVARVLLERGARIDVADRGGLTPAMLAVIHGRRDLLRVLLARGADVNARSGTGWTPLTFAAWKGDPELVRLLLDHGAQTDVVDRQGWTPLHYAEWKAEVSRTAAAGQRDAPPGSAAPATRDAEVVPLLQNAARRRADPPRTAEARPLFRVVGEQPVRNSVE
jgi:ankyrin repeat protein